MKKTLTLLILLFSIFLAQAEEDGWILGYQDSNIKIYFYDDLVEKYNKYGVWEKWVYTKPQKAGKKYYTEVKQYVEFDEDFNFREIYEIIGYDNRGNVVESFHDSFPSPQRIVPQSLGEAITEAIYDWFFEDE